MTRRVFSWSPAFAFVFAMGVVNLFADTTYEGGGAINGPFLGSLGASALAISVKFRAGIVNETARFFLVAGLCLRVCDGSRQPVCGHEL